MTKAAVKSRTSYPAQWDEDTCSEQARSDALVELGVPFWYLAWAYQARRRQTTVLPDGMRWLDCRDRWQPGDEYDMGGGKWHSPVEGRWTEGRHVDLGTLCYIPRGYTVRLGLLYHLTGWLRSRPKRLVGWWQHRKLMRSLR